jgi:chromosome segregation ATPase
MTPFYAGLELRKEAILTGSTTRIFRTLALCLLPAFAVADAFAVIAEETTIRTSTGTFKLSPSDPASLADETAMRSARRATELALAAVAEDVGQLENKQSRLDDDFQAFDRSLNALKAELASRKKKLDTQVASLDDKLDAYILDMKAYNAEVDDQRAQVDASNALRPDQRNSANVGRLNSWGERLEARRTALQARSSALDRDGQDYDRKADEYDAFRQSRSDEMKLAFEKLSSRQEELSARFEEAYRQLKLCYAYAQKIDQLLSEKYNVKVSSAGLMQDVGERLKNLSNGGFDGPATGSTRDAAAGFFGKP